MNYCSHLKSFDQLLICFSIYPFALKMWKPYITTKNNERNINLVPFRLKPDSRFGKFYNRERLHHNYETNTIMAHTRQWKGYLLPIYYYLRIINPFCNGGRCYVITSNLTTPVVIFAIYIQKFWPITGF